MDAKEVRKLIAELAEAKRKQSAQFTQVRGMDVNGRPATVEDARHGARVRMAESQSPNVRARDPEIVRLEIALALAEAGVPYPDQSG